jgi:predicted GNAT family acetyltransferase
MSTVVRDVADAHRYEIIVDGQVAGFEDYTLRHGGINLVHTEVDTSFSGQGLAATLVTFALDDARSRGLKVRPYCPYVAKFIREHEEQYLDLVDEKDRARFQL